MSKKTSITILIALLSLPGLLSGSEKYSSEMIKAELLENASVVVRLDSTLWEVRGRDRARITRKLVITVMEQDGLAQADLSLYHDSFRKIRNVTGRLYDAQGRKIRELKSDEFEDTHIAGGVSVYGDARTLQTDLYMSRYPFTIVYEYTVDERILFPSRLWMPVSHTKTSLEKASLTYIVPEDFSFRYKSVNHPNLEPEISSAGRRNLEYHWMLKDLEAYAHEPYMPGASFIFPFVQTGPNQFNYGGYSGSMESWEKFGLWIQELNKGKQNLSNQLIADIKNLSDNTPDTLERIRKVYEYMQSRTRYVSIQLGIGGFQPDEAENVERNAYGDCKALSNFTQALLHVAGIKSYYSLVFNGNRFLEVDPDFPYQYFNHVILCIPLGNDTIWLETTSNILPMGYIGESNSDRWVLIVTESGGKLARTPEINPTRNQVNQKIYLKTDNEFNITGNLIKELSGLAQGKRMGISLLAENWQRDYLTNHIKLNNFQLHAFQFSENSLPPGSIEKSLDFGLDNYFRRAGNRYIFQPVLLHNALDLPRFGGERIYDFHLNAYKAYNDSILWNLPQGYSISQLPEDFKYDTPFGNYSIQYNYEKASGVLQVIRQYYGKRGKFPAEDWGAFVAFLRTVQSRDRNQIMLLPE